MSQPLPTVVLTLHRTGAVLAARATVATTWRSRMTGLLGHASLAAGEALILPRCNAIHMVGMRFSIDAIFIDRHGAIVGLKPSLRPGSVPLPVLRAEAVIEVSEGTILQHQLQLGDRVTTTGSNFTLT